MIISSNKLDQSDKICWFNISKIISQSKFMKKMQEYAQNVVILQDIKLCELHEMISISESKNPNQISNKLEFDNFRIVY